MPRTKTATGPRGLSKDVIVQAAVDLMEETGEAAFTLRKLGERVGCDPMAVLYHFKSKEGLSRAMANLLTDKLRPVDETLPWRERLRDLASQYRDLARGYPSTFGLMQRFLNTGVADFIYVEMVYRALGNAGIAERDTPMVCLGWYASVFGLLMAEISGLSQPASEEELAEIEQLPADGFPLTKRFAPFYRELDAGSVYARTVDVLLDGIAYQGSSAARTKTRERIATALGVHVDQVDI